MEKETIKALQTNEKPMSRLTLAIQNSFQSAWQEDVSCLEHLDEHGSWFVLGSKEPYLNRGTTFRLKADYAELRIVEEKVFIEDNRLRYTHDEDHHSALMWAPNRPDFIGFKSDGWLFGRMYKNKITGVTFLRILAEDIKKYEVLPIDAVLFANAK